MWTAAISYLICHISYLISHISAPRASEWFSWLQSAKPPLEVTKTLFPSFDTSWSLTHCWPPADRAAHSEAAADWMALWRWQRFMSRCSGARRCVSRCERFFWRARPLSVSNTSATQRKSGCLLHGGTSSWPRPRLSPDRCVYYWRNVRSSARRHPSAA